MSTNTTQSWLELAEQEHAEAEARRWADNDVWASGIAKDINVRLEELGITPLTKACTDGRGKLIPAQLTDPDPKQKFYGVYASYDEECESVTLLATVQPGYDSAHGLGETGHMLRNVDAAEARRLIVNTRRQGPKPKPRAPEPLSAADLIVATLDDIRAALDNIARIASRP